MEDRSNPIPPSATDSLGRSVGILRNFSQCSDNFLLNIKNSLCLEMELHELKACRDSYSRSKRNDISLSTLYLFDGIVKGAKKLSVNKAIDNAFFVGLDIFDTYKDMFEKHCLLCGEDISPLSLNSAANVGPRYMSMIGLPCQGKNEFPSFLEENTAFSIILPTAEMSLEEYELLIKKLVFEQDIYERYQVAAKEKVLEKKSEK